MKKILLVIFSVAVCMWFVYCIASNKSEVMNEVEYAKSIMRPWQVEQVNNIGLSLDNAKYYVSQKNYLAELVKDNESIRDLANLETLKNKQKEKLLDVFHEYLGHWFLMRENMMVLGTEQYDGKVYCVILTAGYEGTLAIYLVNYSVSDEGDIIVVNAEQGDLPLSSGFYPNVACFDEPILFGVTMTRRYDPLSDKRVPSNFSIIEIERNNGEVVTQSISEPAVIIIFLKGENDLIECRLIDINHKEVEKYSFK